MSDILHFLFQSFSDIINFLDTFEIYNGISVLNLIFLSIIISILVKFFSTKKED